MKILVAGFSLGAEHERMRLAALGLALRGHDVAWRDTVRMSDTVAIAAADGPGGVPSAPRPLPDLVSLLRTRADVVLGGGGSPLRVAVPGWLVGACGMVLDFGSALARAWGPVDRWAWESLGSLAVADPRDQEGGLPPPPVPTERRFQWSSEARPALPTAAHPDVDVLERACECSLARRHGGSLRPAVFLDRDGTLIVERGYLSRPDEMELLPGVPAALRRLSGAGVVLVVISNQSGVGRGLFSLESLHATMARLRVELRTHGVEIDAIYFCPHRPDEDCGCRKPKAELLERAAQDLRLSLPHSAMIGDKRIDVAAGQRGKALGILVRTGYGREEERAAASVLDPVPDAVCDDLEGAAGVILERLEQRRE